MKNKIHNFRVNDEVYVIDVFNTNNIIFGNENLKDTFLKENKVYHIKELKYTNELHIILKEYPNSSFLYNRFISGIDLLVEKYNL